MYIFGFVCECRVYVRLRVWCVIDVVNEQRYGKEKIQQIEYKWISIDVTHEIALMFTIKCEFTAKYITSF